METSKATLQHLEGKMKDLTQDGTTEEVLQHFEEIFQEMFLKIELYLSNLQQLQQKNLQLTMDNGKREEKVELMKLKLTEKVETVKDYETKVQLLEEDRKKQLQEVWKWKTVMNLLQLDSSALKEKKHQEKVRVFEGKLAEMSDQVENKELEDIDEQMVTVKKKNWFHFLKRRQETEVGKKPAHPEEKEGEKDKKKMGRFRKWMQKFKETN